jgi:phosphoglycolate phosphatase-like HAD superfamily hydrolase
MQTDSLRPMKKIWCKDDLVHFEPKYDVLVAIDSDGCVFDSMTIKQRIFHTGIIKFWGLEAAESEFRRVAEWVALFSPWRGLNRFELLLKIFQCLEQYFPTIGKEVDRRSLEAFVKSGVPLSADELAKRIDQTGDLELKRALDWSRAVSKEISAVQQMPVFPEVFQALEKIRATADAIVVSQTDEFALVHEWHNAELVRFIDVIAGAELGSKIESLGTAMKGRYLSARTLMVGDAPGDLATARATGSLFFPIIPGDEPASWVELREEGLARLLNGTFDGDYQDDLIARFNTVLSIVPPWV